MGLGNVSIEKKFTILTCVVGIFMLVISIFGYLTASDNLKKSVDDEVAVTIEKAAGDVNGWLEQRITYGIATSNLMTSYNGDYTKIKDKSSMSLGRSDKNVLDIGVGLEDGTFTSYVLGLTKLDPRTRGWYTNMKSSNKEFMMTDPYVDSNTGNQVISVVTPIKANGQFTGAICTDIGLDVLDEQVKKIKYQGQGNATFIDKDGNIIATASPALEGLKNLKDLAGAQEHYNNIISDSAGVFTSEMGGEDIVFGYARVESADWIVVFTVPADVVFESLGKMKIIYAIMTVIGLLIIVAFCIKFSHSITQPIVRLEYNAKELSEGNLRVENIPIEGNDEIGSLTNAFNVMSKNLREVINKMASTSEQVAASSEELTASAQQSADASVKVAETVGEVSNDIAQQLSDIDGAKQSIDVVFDDIQTMAEKAKNVSETSNKTAEAAKLGEELMTEAVDKMGSIEKSVLSSAEVIEKLGESSKQIGQIVEAISGIADQTNLLALNAAIEAARAGEHGRGFAVVSEEVRKLAEQSQISAEQIRERISAIQADTENAVQSMKGGTEDVKAGTEAIREVGIKFKEIMSMVDGIIVEIDGINNSVHTVSDGANKIVEATDSIDKVSRATNERTQSISSATESQSASNEEIAAASQALSNLAMDMQSVIGQFKI